MDLTDLYHDADTDELAELGSVFSALNIPNLAVRGSVQSSVKGAPFFGVARVPVKGNVRTTGSVLTKAMAKARQAGATTTQLVALQRASPAAQARIASAPVAQVRALMKGSPAQVKALARATPAQLQTLRRASAKQAKALSRATPVQVKALSRATPTQKAALARVVKRLPIKAVCPGAYRKLACASGVGGAAGLSMLQHIKRMVDLANTRALATSEHNTINNTLAFRRAVLKGLRQRRRAC